MMAGRSATLIATDARDRLGRLVAALSARDAALLDRVQAQIAARIPPYAMVDDFVKPARTVEGIFRATASGLGADERHTLNRALVARLALQLPAVIDGLHLPESVVEAYPDAFGRLADFLTRPPTDEPYDASGEYFRKDMRFALGLSVPCGARVIDLSSRVPLPTVLVSVLRAKDPSVLVRYVAARGTGRWFRHHVDSRHVSEFTPDGLERFYVRVADMLKRRPEIRGLTGTSWYYDPMVSTVSPRLAYLNGRLGERGAFFLRHGTNPSAVANATKTSETRRRLYREGKYTPVSYSMLWPRRELLAWAEQAFQPPQKG